jgi:hypothetical protein
MQATAGMKTNNNRTANTVGKPARATAWREVNYWDTVNIRYVISSSENQDVNSSRTARIRK